MLRAMFDGGHGEAEVEFITPPNFWCAAGEAKE